MVQVGDDDLIARVESPHQRPAEVEGQAGHVGTKYDLLRIAGVKEVSRSHAGLLHQRIRLAAGGEGTFVVGVMLHQVIIYPIEYCACHLGTGWVIQEDGLARERGIGIVWLLGRGAWRDY